ncbi:glycosyltransferase family 2 protein [Sphingobacterium paludis]|uniref:Glycosyltransferase involved in cell wall biosynthesis n=1 Tax=Sphingobacterium paludis TaxID=1476465 RepID=A0A4R7D2D2_9SPHI|nr:glycosyltransferase family 2 protein [Sphingobacterium paludis]TDS13734.1 glycosyltransferase involved in cell wall biosynthesis [Sphingobacterium paludis]
MVHDQITTVILTYNEEKHIQRCIENAKRFSETIFLVDSFSSDRTKEIAESMGAIVYQNKWENNYARQLNWGLDNLPIKTPWVFRLDADEYLSDALIDEIHEKFPTMADNISGVVMERKMIFLGKVINRGNVQWNMLRLFKYGKGICEERWMDEHIVLTEGKSVQWKNCFYDDNLNPLGWWISKHNGYSIREAVDLLNIELNFLPENNSHLSAEMSKDAEDKRLKKQRYARMPLFWRSFSYFIYRYFFKLGFLEGKEGFLWHTMQGLWYRSLVDAKVYEVKKHCGDNPLKIKKFVKENYNIDLGS